MEKVCAGRPPRRVIAGQKDLVRRAADMSEDEQKAYIKSLVECLMSLKER
jgi:hypothetical protein